MTSEKVSASSSIEVFDDSVDVALLERLLDRIEKYPHELLHVLLLERLLIVPLEAFSQLRGCGEWMIARLQTREEFLDLVYDAIFLRRVDRGIVSKEVG